MYGSEKSNSSEIGLLWQRLVPLENQIEVLLSDQDKLQEKIKILNEKVKKPSESQEEAQKASRSIAQYKGKIQRTKTEVDEITEKLTENLEQSSNLLQEIERSATDLDERISEYTQTFNGCNTLFNEVSERHENVVERINNTIELLDENNELSDRLHETHDLIEKLNEADSKAQGILRNIASHHSKVRELRDEIIGYEAENEDGETERIEGLKDELESTYSMLSQEMDELNENLIQLKNDAKNSYNDLLTRSDVDIKAKLNNQEEQYNEVYQRIIDLLPAALTAGLSAAYNEKVESEEKEITKHSTAFEKAIKWLVAISIIPFLTDIYLLVFMKQDLVSVIAETPKLILSILPLYFPVLWMAYSSNKKMNLSKRLIEEYTHKGVLSKTFEGLSTQIEELNDDNSSSELRVKLLFNLLHVNSENPGKLISNYKTTDHPLMDALEKSVKLADAIDKLKNIPGLTKLAAKLEKESSDILKDTDNRITKALTTLNDITEKDSTGSQSA
ncbi:hypothetical protein L1D32_16745 [Shewanella insulae]|uniref:hypothetical protein n=1 Tax=Shewanella insulae TaxID=2681496 RepID=UPI001EFDA926|nr:hypothetical protein [Shewanella insulae]MCG9739815.1 hypothetical protein [Shewanella insulae]